MSTRQYLATMAISVALIVGCAPQVEPEQTDRVEQKTTCCVGYDPDNVDVGFGADINGTIIRGLRRYHGVWYLMTDTSEYGAVVDSIKYNGEPVTALTTTQGWFQVTTANLGTVKVYSSGFQLDLHVASPFNGTIRLSYSDDRATYGRYDVHYLADTPGASWESFCKHWWTSNGVTTAVADPLIPIGGLKWTTSGSRLDDSTAISFGCTNDAIGGCVDWGYAPWDSATYATGFPPQFQTVSLKDYHQACTRMKRADFCGVGHGNTTSNSNPTDWTQLHVGDSAQLHSLSPQTRSTMEAYWGVNGATCFNQNKFRSLNPAIISKMQADLQTYCPSIPACSNTTITGLTNSGRVCTQNADSSWTCP